MIQYQYIHPYHGESGERYGKTMTFKVIETQEQFDAMVKERLDRAKETARKETLAEFSDYEDLKKQVDQFKQATSEKDSAIKDLETRLKTTEKEKDDALKKTTAVELTNTKIKVANDLGIPIEMAERLTGDDEESIRQDAEHLKEYFAPKTAPLGSYEKSGEPDRRDQLRQLLNGN